MTLKDYEKKGYSWGTIQSKFDRPGEIFSEEEVWVQSPIVNEIIIKDRLNGRNVEEVAMELLVNLKEIVEIDLSDLLTKTK